MAHLALAARYVFPVDAPPLEDGVVTIDGERIVSVGRRSAGDRPIELGNVALIPGLVNAHTHLEFSDLAAPLGEPGMPLPTWLSAVVEQRRAREPQVPSPVARGLRESIECGVTLCGEIARPEWSPDEFENAPIYTTVFVELIGLAAERIEPLTALAEEHLRRTPGRNWRPGISPHAPYSIHPTVVEQVSRAASQSIVAMHLAESREELQWLRAGGGPFADLLAALGVDATGLPCGVRPLDYLRRLSHAGRSLVIHGNYLDDEELEFLAMHAARISLVYCPRTHAYFGHAPYPLAKALAMGINVAVGTDSRASNPDLNLLSELRHIARHHPEVSPQQVLELGTIAGSRALGRDADVGTLSGGKFANLAAISLPDSEGDPYELLLASDGACCGSWFRGVAR